jgi:hypothetical protein
MNKLILGFIIGIFFAAGMYFYYSKDTKLRIDIGRMLDQDVVYLKDGNTFNGWILQEGKDDILIQVEKSTFTVPKSSCVYIKKDILMRYLRGMM